MIAHTEKGKRHFVPENLSSLPHIDNNTFLFGNFVDADIKLADLQDYLQDINRFINRKTTCKRKKLEDSILKNIALANQVRSIDWEARKIKIVDRISMTSLTTILAKVKPLLY